MKTETSPPEKNRRRKRLGELLVESGLIDEKTLVRALEIQKENKQRIGQILKQMGATDDTSIALTLSQQLQIPMVRLEGLDVPGEVLSLVSREMAEGYALLPLRQKARRLSVAMVNPLEFQAIDDLRFMTGMDIDVAVAPEREMIAAIDRLYPQGDLEREFGAGPAIDADIEVIKDVAVEEKNEQELLKLTNLAPVVRFTNAILADAIKMRASDVHIEPHKASVIVRYRIDGIMNEIMKTDRHVHASLVSRIKILAGMDITIRRKPQDGRARVRHSAKPYDLRVSTIPTSFGEKVTIRILDSASGKVQIEDLGFSEKDLKTVNEALKHPQGTILVTGPTGSGKSSTMYAFLNRLNSPEVNIVTVEDPVEYEIDGINQVPINPKGGITFAAGLRSILRQDPDIVMVGEIRDEETARIAFQAAQTGHLVLSTLHTNDAPATVMRLLDLGLEDYLISASLVAVVGQRLVRKICPQCKETDPVGPEMIQQILLSCALNEVPNPVFYRGKGCEACQYSGYQGRLGLFEVLWMSPAVKAVISHRVSDAAIRQIAEREGYCPMAADGVTKALAGLTTLAEVFRVTPPVPAPGIQAPLQYPHADGAVEEPEEIDVVEPVASVTSIRQKKVLLVDDDQTVLRMLSYILESENYQVVTAGDGLEAFKSAMQERPDLIVTDLQMPRMNGIELVHKLKSQLATRYIPIIMLTAHTELESEVDGINAGADDYLTKPVDPRRLLARAGRFLKNA